MSDETHESHGSDAVSDGVRVETHPHFVPDYSDPGGSRFVFGYRVRITNDSSERVSLRSRHLIIVDSAGTREDIQGDGVVGEQPDLEPGDTYEYSGFWSLTTRWGTVEGSYRMLRPDGAEFDAAIARFYLVAPQAVAALA